MKRISTAIVAAGLALVLSAGAAQAQSVNVGVGAGATLPLGDFNDVAKLGWHGVALIGYGMPSGLGFRGEFFYGQNSLDPVDGKVKLAGGMANVTYDFQTAGGLKPYVLGGVGYFQVKVEPDAGGSADESKVAFGGGVGLKFRAGTDSNIFVESRYLSVSTSGSSTNFIPITVGVSFGLN